MSTLRRLLQLLLVLSALSCAAARASTGSSEITDMWWNPAESGWGVNVILQGDTAFLTFFVYDPDRIPIWYTSDAHLDSSASSLTWTGKLYETRGPWFGGAFAPPTTIGPVGTVSFVLNDQNAATLVYSVNGVTVAKSVERQTWTLENFTGDYLGGYSVRNTNCTSAAQNGIEEAGGVMTMTQTGTAVSAIAATTAGTCTYTGSYAQYGKLGQVTGTYTCSNGVQGSFQLFEMAPTISGFTARIIGQNQFCDFAGTFGGITRVP
jgi:hypothetical protein